jgi:hypothetical protein
MAATEARALLSTSEKILAYYANTKSLSVGAKVII